MAKRALLIYNPVARSVPKIERLRAAAAGVAGWQITIEPTTSAGHATELARQAGLDGYDVVLACGGDGTVNEVANGLASGTTALAVVRGGTANVWAKEIGVPKDPAKALHLLLDGETRIVDLGKAGKRYFLLMAGVGFDAAVVRDLSSGTKQRLGAMSFILAGLRQALRYRETAAEVETEREPLPGPLFWLLFGNSRSYGGVVNLTDRARIDDGRLEMYLLRRGGLLRLLWLLPWVMLHKHHGRPHVLHRQIESAEVRTAGLPVQLDGEYVGETPLHITIVPGALRIIVPRGRPNPLFSQEN